MFHFSINDGDDEGLFRRSGNLAAMIRNMLFGSSEVGVMYDPSDLTSMFQDSTGTTPVTAVGDPVGKILDKSGRGNHATQSTSTARPVLQQDSNGRYYLAFDGTDDFLVTSSINFTGTDKMSVFAGVYKGQDAATAIIAELSADSTGNAGTFYMTAPSSGGATDARFAVIDGVAAAVTADKTSGYTTGLSVLAGTSDNSANTVQLRFNATLAQLTSTVQAATVFDSAPIYIGMRGGTTLPFNGRIYSLIVRGAFSDAAQIAAVEAYVNSKTAAY